MTQQGYPGQYGGDQYAPPPVGPPGAPPYGAQPPQQYAHPPVGGYAVPSGTPGYGHIGHPPPGGFVGQQHAGYAPQAALAPNGQPLADVWVRLGARLLDSLILSGVMMIVAVPVFVVAVVIGFNSVEVNSDGTTSSDATPFFAILVAYVVYFVLALAAQYVYDVELAKRTGQTVGKRVLKVRVTPLDPNQPLDRGVLARRWLVSGLGALVPGLGTLNVLWCLWDQPYRQCLHDKFAKTVVVKVPA